MKIRLLAFASASDALGSDELEIELPAGSDLTSLKQLLEARAPGLVPLWPRLAIAIDGAVVGADHPLRDGAEVALLPPVSGGSGAARVALVDTPIDVAAVTAAVSSPARGAVVLFLGTVRSPSKGREISRLSYSAYRPMAFTRLGAIAQALEAEEPGVAVAITHRLGELSPGEASVVIAVASPHRAAAYEVSRRALERLKAEVPIWKRELYEDGEEAWREEELLVPAV